MAEKELSMEEMAGLSIDQIDAMASGGSQEEQQEPSVDDSQADATKTNDTEQAAEEGAPAGAVEEEADGSGVAMKSGKGTIPYSVLKETREELAETKRRLEALESKKSYHAEVPEDHGSLLAQTNEKINALAKAFDEGEKSLEEFQAELAEITTGRESLLAAKIKAEIADEMRVQSEQDAAQESTATWFKTVEKFLAGKPDGIDYQADQKMYGELDAAVKMFASNPANASKGNQWFLDKAHREVMENNGIKKGAAPETPSVKNEPPPKDKENDGKPPIFSLSDIPGGIIPDGGTEAEQVASLSGAALTNRFLNDPAQIDKVLAGLR